MSKIEQSSRPDLAFHDRAPSTVTFRVQKGETGAPTVGSEIEIPAFHLFAVSTATEASAEAREPITPRNAEQAVHEYPVIAKTKKTLCLGKTFPLLTLGTDNPVPGPQVLSEISGLKKLREWGIDVPIIDGWVNGDEIPTTTPAKETYERLFPAEKTKSDKTAREKHIERLQAAESYNIEMMSAPLLTPEDAALFAEATGDNKETHLTALRKICELAMNPDDSKAVLSHSQMLVTHEAPKIFEVDTARYAGENDGTYGFGYAAKPPAQTPWQIHSPTHNPTPLFYIQETGTAKNRAALVFEIRAGKAINTFNRADSHSSFKGPARTLDAVQKRVADFVKLLYKYQ